MENKHAMTVIAEDNKQDVTILREFDAPPELVFKAFTTPEILVEFFAPPGLTMDFHYHDYKSNGRYSWFHKDQHGNVVCTFNGVIHELTSPIRLIQTAEFMEIPERGHVVLEKMTFEMLPNNRTKLTIHDVCFSVADRDEMVRSGMTEGLELVLHQLDSIIPRLMQVSTHGLMDN